MRDIEAALSVGDSNVTAQRVKICCRRCPSGNRSEQRRAHRWRKGRLLSLHCAFSNCWGQASNELALLNFSVAAGDIQKLLRQFEVELKLELDELTSRIEEMEAVIQQTAKENDACQRLTTIPGVGL